ncbi:MAG: hypothetical protein ACOCWG_04925 [bacterium]
MYCSKNARPAELIKYDRLLSYYPDTGNPFFNGVSRRYYAHNNPLKIIDPDGREEFTKDDDGNHTWKFTEKDTYSEVGSENGFTMDEMKEANPGKENYDKIKPGEKFNMPQSKNVQAYQWAKEKLDNGSKEYTRDSKIDNYEQGYNKCNKFVGDAYTKGANVTEYPTFNWKGREMYSTTSQFISNSIKRINNGSLEQVFDSRPGDIAIFRNRNHPESGHAAIVGLRNNYIGASTNAIMDRSGSFMLDGFYYPTYWRKTGE